MYHLKYFPYPALGIQFHIRCLLSIKRIEEVEFLKLKSNLRESFKLLRCRGNKIKNKIKR